MSEQKDSIQRISRRDFARQAVVAAAAATALPANLFPEPAIGTPPAPQAPAETPKLSPESQAEVDAKIQTILRKHGARLSDEEKKDLRRLVTEGQPSFERLRAYPIENGDGPATIFVPYRSESSPGGAAPQSGKAGRRPKRAVREKRHAR